MKIKFILWSLCLSTSAVFSASLQSPTGKLGLSFNLTNFDNSTNCLAYSVSYDGEVVVGVSGMGFELENGSELRSNFEIIKIAKSSHGETWKPVYGERKKVRDHYVQMVVELAERVEPYRRLELTFRVYDEGIAFCYTIPSQQGLTDVAISKELTEFRFADDHTAYTAYFAQDVYREIPLSKIGPGCERPLTIKTNNGLYFALTEARLVDYARMKLDPLEGHPHALVSSLSGPVTSRLPLTTPWRVVLVADTPGELLENNDLILNLNDPCQIKDTSWIKPGKVIREVSLTTQGGKACVDFAAKHHIEYVEFDAGWYGAEREDSSDARTVTVDPARSTGKLDLHEIIAYAKEKDVGILLYVNRVALEKQLDEILPLYQQWGIKGVKYGFVQVGSQQWTSWLHEAVRKAAQYQLMVDVHDEYRPSGYSRTYPNFMTQEGIRGDEESTLPKDNLTILFTRMLAGAGDNTVCYFDARVDRVWSHAYQLAKAVCFYSPLQFVYWYDRPPQSPLKGGAGGKAPIISEVPELEFFDHLPTVWDDTKVIHGEIGEYATIARRSGDEWFVGTMNADTARALNIPLDFLQAGKKYLAHIYSDDLDLDTITQVRIDKQLVEASIAIDAEFSGTGGQAIRIVPVTDTDTLKYSK